MSKPDTLDWPRVGDTVLFTMLGREKTGEIVDKELAKDYGTAAQWRYTIEFGGGARVKKNEHEVEAI